MKTTVLSALTAALVMISGGCSQKNTPPPPPPLSIEGMRAHEFSSSLTFERALARGSNFSARLVSYASSGLKVYAMIAVPDTPRPPAGFPVLIANHGFHPEPERYGITKDGVDSRPGDYYRAIPEQFAAGGFLVVIPDYRGHNVSEGAEYTEGFLATNYYTLDVLALLSAVRQIDEGDGDNVFMWGHSLGGEVTLRALLVDDHVRGAAIWSPVGSSLWEQAYHYSRLGSDDDTDAHSMVKAKIAELKEDVAALEFEYDTRTGEPLEYLQYLATPLAIHHAHGDESVPYEWSERLATQLDLMAKPYTFYSYSSDEHLFTRDDLKLAVERDVKLFRELMR